MCIKEIAYKKYQLHWLISHGCSIEDISCLASDWFNERLTIIYLIRGLTDRFGFALMNSLAVNMRIVVL